MCICWVLDHICVLALIVLTGHFCVRVIRVLFTSLRVLSVDTCILSAETCAHARLVWLDLIIWVISLVLCVWINWVLSLRVIGFVFPGLLESRIKILILTASSKGSRDNHYTTISICKQKSLNWLKKLYFLMIVSQGDRTAIFSALPDGNVKILVI